MAELMPGASTRCTCRRPSRVRELESPGAGVVGPLSLVAMSGFAMLIVFFV